MGKGSVKIAKRYARSLFELCQPHELDETRQALLDCAEIWNKDQALQSAMLNPAFPSNEREAALRAIAAQIAPQLKTLPNFMALLLENKRLSDLALIAQSFCEMVDNFRRLLALEVTSAFELPAQEKESLLKRVQSEVGASASIEWKVDAQLIGGLRIKAGDRVLDGSLNGSLERFRNELMA